MGSCANGGGYYHYSYSVVRGCDREYFAVCIVKHGCTTIGLVIEYPRWIIEGLRLVVVKWRIGRRVLANLSPVDMQVRLY